MKYLYNQNERIQDENQMPTSQDVSNAVDALERHSTLS